MSAGSDNGSDDLVDLPEYLLGERIIDNRAYQVHSLAEDIYCAPIDQREIDRQNNEHSMIQFMLGDKLFIVPHTKLPVIRRVLDLGMGTGAWSIAVARSYPSCNVTGIELVPHLLPAEEDQPSNLEIQVDDLNNPFTWPVDHFDFIQSRNVLLGISRPWGEYMKDCTRILRAGGWLQFIEFEWCLKTDPPNQIPKGSAIHQWNTYFSEAMEDREKPRNLGEPSRLNHHMQGAGLTDVSQRMLRVPLWPWSSIPHENDIADKFSGQVTLSLAHLSQYMITTYCGVSLNEFYILMASVRNEIEQRQYRVYLPLYVCLGKKPDQPSS